jgi:sugar O-acyltransferase (sialic acid O-acetyltransferase NeuD family)
MEKILLFPFNGNALEASDCLNDDFKLIGFIDDVKEVSDDRYKVFKRDVIDQFLDAKIMVVPGSPTTYLNRSNIIKEFEKYSTRFTTLIHPSASISKHAKIGKNVLIMAGVVISANAIIEDHVCILPNSVIHHDSIIKKYTLIGSNVSIAGSTVVEENCYIGSHTSIINNITIGEKSLIGIGTNVICSLPALSKSVGNPSRCI